MKYTLQNIIGEGACGTVYKALDTNNERVSIKIIPKNKNPREEIQILRTLDHDNILKYIDVYETPSSICLVTELCEYSLITFINEYNVDLNISKKIIRMILCGLEYLHSKNIIHRDIKLANILIKENSVKICDFGLSCYENTNKYSVCGTEDYIAPEIINKTTYTKSVDVYSTGKVFKTLLSLKNEKDHKSYDLLSKMLESNPRRRITAYEALRHPVFKDFYPKFCDFRYLKNFRVNEKFGIIEKKDHKVYFDDTEVEIYDIKEDPDFYIKDDHTQANNENLYNTTFKKSPLDKSLFYNIEYENLRTFTVSFSKNNIKKEIFLFSNAELKKIIYGMAYLNLKMERLPLIVLEDPKYKFTYLLNDGFVYYDTNFVIKRKSAQKDKLKNGKFIYEITDLSTKSKTKHEILPTAFKDRQLEELYTKCLRNLINVDIDNLPLILKFNINGLNYSTPLNHASTLGTFSSVGSILDMKIRNENIYKYKANVGWSIKRQNTFIFLLNDGKCFEIDLYTTCVRYQNEIFSINNSLPTFIKRDLKRIKDLLLMYI